MYWFGTMSVEGGAGEAKRRSIISTSCSWYILVRFAGGSSSYAAVVSALTTKEGLSSDNADVTAKRRRGTIVTERAYGRILSFDKFAKSRIVPQSPTATARFLRRRRRRRKQHHRDVVTLLNVSNYIDNRDNTYRQSSAAVTAASAEWSM